MNITKQNSDALNAVVKIEIVAEDYQEKVSGLLEDYRKKADIPGFRKGHVPMGMIKKQYGKSIMIDEVNKLIQASLNKYLTDEKLEILGNPIPRMQEDFNWEAEVFSFEFELGLAPQFDVNLNAKKEVTQYNIIATEELIDKEVENIQARYGTEYPTEVATATSNVTGTFVSQEKEIDKKATFSLKDVKGKINLKKFVGAKSGAFIELKTKGLFTNEYQLESVLGIPQKEVVGLDINVTFTLEATTETVLAELDQELFNKLFPDGSVTTVTAVRAKIKEDAEKQFSQQGDQQLLNAVTEYLVENTKFDLPADFLKKWLATAGEKQLSTEEAAAEYAKSEKALRYQLIEGKIMKDNDIKLDYAELVNYAKGFIRTQMAQFGNMNPEEKELDDIATRILSNQEEAQKLQAQLMSQKLLTFFKENMSFKSKELSYEKFVKEVYK
ncbi:MAG: trigger factor [Polaribacter sp.]|nr:trigger factor [Polaribacter sp.]